MNTIAERFFRIRSGEGWLTIALGFLLLANSIAQQIAGVVGYSGFLEAGGPNAILIVWIVIYISIAVVATLQMLWIDRFNRVRVMQWLCLGFAGIFLVLRLMFAAGVTSWIPYSLLYIISDQQWLTFPTIFWILASDALDMSQAKRLFPLIASIGFIGKLIGIAVAGLSPAFLRNLHLPNVEVLSVIVVLYVLAFFIARSRFKSLKVRVKPKTDDSAGKILGEAWEFIRGIPVFRYLMISVGALMACSVVLEFYFTVFTKARIPNEEDYQTFYSAYRLGLTLVSFAAQAFFTSRLISRIPLKKVFMVLPISVLVAMVASLISPGLITAVAALIAYKLPRETLDESAHKSLRSLVPEERRGRVSLFMDSTVVGVSAILACLVTVVLVVIGPQLLGDKAYYLYLGEGAILAAVGVWAAWKVHKTYDDSMLNWRLQRRRKASKILDSLEF